MRNNNDIELEPVNKKAYDPDRPRTSSVLATNFRLLGDQMKNNAMADESRRISRKTKGLNPDAPRPQPVNKGEPLDEKEAEKMKAKEKAGEIQKMDEHKIPMDELCHRFGTSL